MDHRYNPAHDYDVHLVASLLPRSGFGASLPPGLLRGLFGDNMWLIILYFTIALIFLFQAAAIGRLRRERDGWERMAIRAMLKLEEGKDKS